MLIPFFYALNLLLLLSGLLGIRLDSGVRRFSLALVQSLLGLPLLAGEYLYLAYHLEAQAVQVVLFSEIVFALIWLSMAQRLRRATVATVREPRLNSLIEIIAGAVVTVAAGYFMVYRSIPEISDAILAFHHYSPIYFSAVFILLTSSFGAPSRPRGDGSTSSWWSEAAWSAVPWPGAPPIGSLTWPLSQGILCSWQRFCFLAGL
ncbi:MAG: hypothetical protein JRI62_10400 [Deltaproteobacteria bacterium]|nr:hypothetical protein [Deltaproteobacteria bacterium]